MDKDLKEIVDKCVEIYRNEGKGLAESYLNEDIRIADFLRLAEYFNCKKCEKTILQNILDYKQNEIKPLTQQEFEIVKMICESKGIDICDVYLNCKLQEFPYLMYEENVIYGYEIVEIGVISFNQFLEIASKHKSVIKLQLTDQYEAIVKDNYVKVGCQEVSFGKVKELYELIKDK